MDQVIQELRAEARRIPGINVFMQNPPPIRIGGTVDQEPVSAHAAGCRSEGTLHVGAADREARMASAAGIPGRDHAICRSAARRSSWISTATRRLPLGVTAGQIQDALYTRIREPAGLDHLYARRTHTGSSWKSSRNISASPKRCRKLYVRSSRGSSFRWTRWPD